MMINPEIDLFLSFFPWNDCRIYHNRPLNQEEEKNNESWRQIILSSMPVDSEYLVKATYTDAVTIASEYLLFKVDGSDYVPSISPEYLKYVVGKSKEERAECPYHLLLAQIFQAYFHFFSHEELYIQFIKWSDNAEAGLEVLSSLFETAIKDLGEYLAKIDDEYHFDKKKFLSEMLNGALAALKAPPVEEESSESVFSLKVKKKRNNPWANSENSTSSKSYRTNDSEYARMNPYYSMPNGKLPLLSQAVSMVLADEFHFDCKQPQRLMTIRGEARPGETESARNGIVHRRQKLKRRRFRLVFYDDNVAALTLGQSAEMAAANKVQFDPHNFDENNPAVKKSGYLALKGVVALTNTRFRVQLNAFKHERKKFSRNTCDLNEALWIFEVCLLVSDSPPNLTQLLRIGNYQSLILLPAEFNYFRNPIEYFIELGRQILMFSYSDDCFPKTLIDIAINNFENLILNVLTANQVKEQYAEKLSSFPTEGSDTVTKEHEFWRAVIDMFTTGKSIKQSNHDFFTLFKKCPQTPIPPKVYMSKEQ